MLPTTGAYILDTITHDGYIIGQRFYKLLLAAMLAGARRPVMLSSAKPVVCQETDR
jgi:hypothetical protein